MTKRLFIFASYDKDAIIDNTVLYYLRALSELGNIIFFMDNDTLDTELAKVRKIPNVIYADALRHAEYDFGSYKRGFCAAKQNDILKNYDFVYLVNDSVFGPFKPLCPILEKMESANGNITGIVYNKGNHAFHIPSWFIGLSRDVFLSDWFSEFICSVCYHNDKWDVIDNYEIGLSNRALNQGCKFFILDDKYAGTVAFMNPVMLLRRGMPFCKKQGLEYIWRRHFRKHCPENIFHDVVLNMKRCGLSFKQGLRTFIDIRIFGIPLFKLKTNTLRKKKPFERDRYRIILFGFIPILTIRKCSRNL